MNWTNYSEERKHLVTKCGSGYTLRVPAIRYWVDDTRSAVDLTNVFTQFVKGYKTAKPKTYFGGLLLVEGPKGSTGLNCLWTSLNANGSTKFKC